MRILALLLLFLWGCTPDKETPTELVGVYTTYKPSYVEQVTIERKYKGRVYPLPAVMIYMRNDGTYVFGNCDNQLGEVGKYEITGDSVFLYERYELENRLQKPPIHIYCDNQKELLFLVTPLSDSAKERYLHKLIMGKSQNQIIPVKKNLSPPTHYGFLRGQEMEYDSILSFYKRHSVQEQDVWTDSVLSSYRKTAAQ